MAALKTRMLKTECRECGYIARVTRTHPCRVGPPLCPCNGERMRCDQWDEILSAEFTELEAATTGAPHSHSAPGPAHRILREKWVTLRSCQECSQCRGELPHGEYAHHRVYTMSGEFVSEYTCARCHPETRSQYSRRVAGYF